MTKKNLQLYDNTRISDHRLCNRYFYWRHRRHFTATGASPALDFGTSWHAAMDVVWPAVAKGLPNDEVVALAVEGFAKKWMELGYSLEPSTDEADLVGFRSIETALGMLSFYVPARRNFIQSTELVQTERPFCVPLDPNNPDLFYVGRIDKVVRENGIIRGIEHKTTSEYATHGVVKESYTASYTGPNSQIDGYSHALKSDFGPEAKGLYVDIALVHKKVHDGYILLPVERRVDDLEAWLWETHNEIARIDENDRALAEAQSHAPAAYLAAFPKNTTACIRFNRPCTFASLCKGHTNPLRYETPPDGFVEKKWEPFEELRLAEIGVTAPDATKV